MSSRKRSVVIAAVVGALVLVTVIGAMAFVVVRNQQRQDDVDAATKVANAYTTKLKVYREAVWTAAVEPGAHLPRATRAALVKAREVAPPRLGDAPAWGKAHSKAYVAAVATEKGVQAPYDRLDRLLEESIVGETFIKAARAALEFDPDAVVKSGIEISGAQFRSRMVPAVERALEKFNDVTVPPGGKAAAQAVRASLSDTLKQARAAAANLEAGREGSMEQGELLDDADFAIADYEGALAGKVGKGLESIAVR